MIPVLPTQEIISIFPECFRIFYDKSNNKYISLMLGLQGKGIKIKANEKKMQKWCRDIVRDKKNYVDKDCRKLFFEAILEDEFTHMRIKKHLDFCYKPLNWRITKKDIDNFINNTLMILS
jgi:hypothetical protein